MISVQNRLRAGVLLLSVIFTTQVAPVEVQRSYTYKYNIDNPGFLTRTKNRIVTLGKTALATGAGALGLHTVIAIGAAQPTAASVPLELAQEIGKTVEVHIAANQSTAESLSAFKKAFCESNITDYQEAWKNKTVMPALRNLATGTKVLIASTKSGMEKALVLAIDTWRTSKDAIDTTICVEEWRKERVMYGLIGLACLSAFDTFCVDHDENNVKKALPIYSVLKQSFTRLMHKINSGLRLPFHEGDEGSYAGLAIIGIPALILIAQMYQTGKITPALTGSVSWLADGLSAIGVNMGDAAKNFALTWGRMGIKNTACFATLFAGFGALSMQRLYRLWQGDQVSSVPPTNVWQPGMGNVPGYMQQNKYAQTYLPDKIIGTVYRTTEILVIGSLATLATKWIFAESAA